MSPEILKVKLPEDIERVKHAGDFDLALKMINHRLKTDIPMELKDRLLFEKDIFERIPEDFTYTKQEALKLLKDNLENFKDEEFDDLFNEGAFEFYYINGQMKFNCRFLMNLTITRKKYRDRLINKGPSSSYLDDAINEMKQKGEVKVKYTVSEALTANNLKKDKTLKVWLPLAMNVDQISEVTVLQTSEGVKEINDSSLPARSIYFETKGVEKFTADYSFVINAKYVNPKEEEVLPYSTDMSEYLVEKKPHVVFTDYLKKLTADVIGEETNPLAKARKIYNFITSKVMYSFMRPYITLPMITEYATTSLKGDCGVQAILFVTMCRIAGVPAKWQSGLFIDGYECGCHDWAMFYVEPYGWLFADCSFGGSAYREGKMEIREFYFGNLDPFRIVQAIDFQPELSPKNNFTRNDPYDNQVGELEYEDEQFSKLDFEFEAKITNIEKN